MDVEIIMTEKAPIYGMYRGRPEKLPGKMIYRHKGSFAKEEDARKAQRSLSEQGKMAKVVKYQGNNGLPYSLYVVAPHDFWKKAFILKRD